MRAQHRKYINEINSEDHSILIIALTMKCNFSGSYCFERDAKSGDMNERTQRQLIDFMSERAKRCRTIDSQWFGGEPLLLFGTIENLS